MDEKRTHERHALATQTHFRILPPATDVSALNTIRDFLKVTTWLTANAVLAASIIVSFTYHVFGRCSNQSLTGCDTQTLYLIAKLVVLLVNFFFVALHMISATKFLLNVEFMLNTRGA